MDGTGWLDFGQELVVDGFAGAGGAGDGIADAYRAPDVKINHSPIAIAVNRANHPNARHYLSDIFEVSPLEATQGKPVGIAWFSPDCTHHSKAKGGKPRSKRIRGLAWVIVRWAYEVRPRIILMENVEEFRQWGPLDQQGFPIKSLKGRTFEAFKAVLTTGLAEDHPDLPEIIDAIGEHVPVHALTRGLGYQADFQELIAADYGTPTIRKRLYGVMRCDGLPIVFPEGEFARNASKSKAKQWPSQCWAAECIDFTDLGQSIFDRKKPLASASQRRIARGCWRHVLASAKPFIVPLRGTSSSHVSTHSVDAPLSTITGGGTRHGLAAPVMIQAAHGEGRPGGVQRYGIGSSAIDDPVRTVTASGMGGHALASCEFAPYLTEFANASSPRTFAANEPLRTQVAQVKGGHFALATAHLMTNTTGHAGAGLNAPMPTLTTGGHHAVVATHPTPLSNHGDRSGHHCDGPMRTVAGANRGEQAPVAANREVVHRQTQRSDEMESHDRVVAPHVVKFRHDSIGSRFDEPLPTVTAGGAMARPAGAAHALGLAGVFLEQANGGPNNHTKSGRSLYEPLSTIVGKGCQQQVVSAYLVKYYRDGGQLQACNEPMHTLPTKARMGVVQVVQVIGDLLPPEQMAKAKRCASFLRQWLPEHFTADADIVMVGDHVLVDITLRMLQPKELKKAQGFREDYILDRGLFHNPETGMDEWRPITKTDQIKLIGNSVCRHVAAALVRANAGPLIEFYARSKAA